MSNERTNERTTNERRTNNERTNEQTATNERTTNERTNERTNDERTATSLPPPQISHLTLTIVGTTKVFFPYCTLHNSNGTVWNASFIIHHSARE